MAISLGSLYVELKANTAQFLDGMTKASVNAKAFGRDLEGGLGNIGRLFAPLGEAGEKLAGVFDLLGSSARSALADIGKSGALVGGLGVLTGGAAALGGTLFALADHAAEVGNKIFEASEKTGIGAQQMSGLMAITKETGGNFDSLVTSLARAGANLQKAIIDPGGKTGKVLSQVMGGMKQLAAEGAKPMGDRLQDVLKHIFEMNNVGERNVALSALLGKGWMENVATLKLLAEQGYGPAIAAAQRMGLNFGPEAAKQAHEFTVAMAEIKAELGGVGLAIGRDVIPAFTNYMVALEGLMPYLSAFWEVSAGVAEMLAGKVVDGLKDGKKGLQDFAGASKASDQAQTDFLVRLQSLSAGEKAAADAEGVLSATTKAHADALANLISREKEQLGIASAGTNESKKLYAEYQHTIEEIQKLVAAGGSYKEGLEAQSLALEVYKQKLMDIKAVMPKMPETPWDAMRKALFEQEYPTKDEFKPPRLEMPVTPSGAISAPTSGIDSLLIPQPLLNKTLAQMAQLPRSIETTRTAERALRLETDLSSEAFAKLAQAFPGLTEGEVAATAAGQRMIEQLSKMDKFGSFADQFKEMTDNLILEGSNFAGNMLKIVGGAIDKLEDKIAEMVVKGRVNFRQLGQQIEQEMIKVTLQKGVSMALSGLTGGKLGASKPDGTAGNPLHVVLAGGLPGGRAGGVLGGVLGSATKAAPGGSGEASAGSESGGGIGAMFSKLESGFSSIFSSLAKSLAPLLKGIGSIFGGFLADGGDVRPNMAYLVGEKGPEIFHSRTAGTIVPHISAQQLRPQLTTVHVHVSGVQDVDGFRKSQSQVAGAAYRAMALAHSRNSS